MRPAGILNAAGIPTYAYPDRGARVPFHVALQREPPRAVETPPRWKNPAETVARACAGPSCIESARARGRTLLTEAESKGLLAAYGIPTVPTEIAATEDDAAHAASRIGYPVVLKLHSETITHKTDVGGVQLNLADEAAVRAAFRAIQDSVVAGARQIFSV